MRPNKYFLFAFVGLVLFFLSSCLTMIVKMAGYFKNPKLEDSFSIIKYSKENNDPYDKLWMASSRENFDAMIERFKGIPTILIYDRNLNVLENANGEGCQYRLTGFFKDSTSNRYILVNDSSFQFLTSCTKEIASNQQPEQYDYVVIYMWAKWTPRFSQTVFEAIREIRQTTKKKTLFISLNKDFVKGHYQEAPKFRFGRTTSARNAGANELNN